MRSNRVSSRLHNLSFDKIWSQIATTGIPTLFFRWNLVPISFQWDSITYLSLESFPNLLPIGFQYLSFVGILSQSAYNGIPMLIFRWNLVPICFQWDSNAYLSLESCPNLLPMGFQCLSFVGILSQSASN